MTELLPCPFCGGEVKIDMLDSENSRNVKIYSAVHCPKCHAWFFKGLSKEKTVAAWNRRAGKDINVATNADRIRNMSDEELAEFLSNVYFGGFDDGLHRPPRVEKTLYTTDWLKQPVKDSP